MPTTWELRPLNACGRPQMPLIVASRPTETAYRWFRSLLGGAPGRVEVWNTTEDHYLVTTIREADVVAWEARRGGRPER
jgi:hypothetical protein